ncbi:INO80 complex subunit B [Coemansia sp. S2]|nr:INO80 complex subunit B [Coemansia sp. S3946]KAJ2047768.1 INO80 complex subunit B [Coemansia sp. S2]
MPPKRKTVRDAESSMSESTSTSESSDVDTATTPQTRLRRSGGRGGSSAPHSPALSTRRSTRLTAQAEQPPPSTNPRGRLTRGVRPGAPSKEVVTSPEPTRRGRGRGRGRTAVVTHSGLSPAPRRRGRPPGKRVRLDVDDSESASESESAMDSEDAADSLEKDDDEESQSESMAGSEEAGAIGRAKASKPVISDSEGEEEDGQANENDDDEEEDEDGNDDREAESVDIPVVRRPVGRPPGRGRGRGRGRPRAAESRPVERAASSELEDSDLIMRGSSQSDVGEEDGESGATTLANLTLRQRSKLTRDHDEELMELPTEAKRSKFSVEEAALRKSENARRRKFQSQQRADQLKHETINKLLNKQTSKGRNKVSENYDTRSTSADDNDVAPDMIRYVQRCRPGDAGMAANGEADSTAVHIDCTLSLPLGVDISSVFPAATDKTTMPAASYPPPEPTCSVDGCQQKKKYGVESHTACSLEHWRLLKAGNA